MDVLKQDRQLSYKQTADKIRQILSKVRETPKHSYRRWIWELMQNAKDVIDPSIGSVSVKIDLYDDKLAFSHNGLPFKVRHLLGIVKQVSTKNSNSEDDEITGKFGTGFIVTHLLSDIIRIKGFIDGENGNFYRLETLELDRSGSSSEELIPKIEEANEYILQVENNRDLFPLEPDYRARRTKSSFDTSFSYHLSSDRKIEAARAGINDLANTLPVTLVSVDEISEVIIKDHTSDTKTHYQLSVESEVGNIKRIRISWDNENQRNFIKFQKDEYCLIAEVTDFETLSIVEKDPEQPVLYRNFPLIGSEKFYFPYILNGYEFNPTEDRDDIVLVNEESPEVQQNRKIIKSAIDGVIEFNKYLINSCASNRYLCAISRIPKLTVALDDGLKDWLIENQTEWREKILDQDLVQTGNKEYSSLRKVLIPNYGITKENKERFHLIATAFLDGDHTPSKPEIIKWIESTGPKDEIETWSVKLWYDLEELLNDLENTQNLENLEEKIKEPFQWLNNLFLFITDLKETEILNDFKVIPNHNGEFKKLEDLYLEDPESPIHDSFLDVLETLKKKWRGDLIHRSISLPGINVDRRSLLDASKEINSILGETRGSYSESDYVLLSNENALDILLNLLSIFDREQPGDFRSKILQFSLTLFGQNRAYKKVDNCQDFQFGTALKLLILMLHERIEKYQDIGGLSDLISKNKDQTVLWLNDYLNVLLAKEDFKNLIEFGSIIPNRLGSFCAYEDVFSFGTEDKPLDDKLIEILSELNPDQDWKKELIVDGIHIKKEARKFEELGAEIDNALREIEKEEAVNAGYMLAFEKPIINLLDWCHQNSDRAKTYLNHTYSHLNDLWVKFSMTPEIMNVLRDESSLELLKKISKANLSDEDKKKIMDVAITFGELSPKGKEKLIQQTAEIAEEEKDFEFKRRIGEKVEDILKELFLTEFPEYQIKYVGKGSYDFMITNPANHKKYSIELKSIKPKSLDPIKMAISQARLASKFPNNYALLVIERTKLRRELTEGYLKQNLKCVYQIGVNVKTSVNNSYQVDSIINSHDSIKLTVEDPTMKVQISQEYISKLGKNFESLKLKVHEAIMV